MVARMMAALTGLALLTGCVTTGPNEVSSLTQAGKVAWSLDAHQSELIVDVSPARKTLQVAGTTGLIVGSTISAVVNDKYRVRVREALEGYNEAELFEQRLAARLEAAMPTELVRVSPLGTTAGYDSKRDAQDARYEAIADDTAADVLLDLDMTYGIFGFEGILATKIDGRLVSLPGGYELWDRTLVVSSRPLLASDGLSDPTKTFGPDLGNLRLTVEEGAVDQWLADGGAVLKQRYEAAVDGVVSALLSALDIDHDAPGEYFLGVNAMNRKNYKTAEEHFTHALTIDPAFVPAMNARAVNLYHNGQVDAAIQLAETVVDAHPDYAPAWLNLAWFHAVGNNDGAAAAPYYEKARALGMPENDKIEKAIAQS